MTKCIVKAHYILSALLIVACSSAGPTKAERIEPGRTKVVVAFPELADAASLAAELWRQATDGQRDLEVVVGECVQGTLCIVEVPSIPDCGGTADVFGCHRGRERSIEVSAELPDDEVVSTIAHEFGHSFKLEHVHDGSLMDPHRSTWARLNPFISTGDDGEAVCVLGDEVVACLCFF